MNENIIYMILLTIDSFDTLKGAIDREDPLSKEHLIDSFEAAALFFGARDLKYKVGEGLDIAGSKITSCSLDDVILENADEIAKTGYVESGEIYEGVAEAEINPNNLDLMKDLLKNGQKTVDGKNIVNQIQTGL